MEVGLCYSPELGDLWKGQGDRLERMGLEEVLRRHVKPDTFRVHRFGLEPPEHRYPDSRP